MKKTAVIADDHEIVREALAAILVQRFGFERVREAGSFDELLSCLDEIPQASLVLLDLDMPGGESVASVAMVRHEHPNAKVAVVSASQRRQDILMALAAGAHGYITKSLGATAVGDALATILSGEVYVPSLLASPEVPVPGPVPQFVSRPLTRRQSEVLALLVEGRSNKDIARRLNLGEGTIKSHVAAILQGLGVPNRSAAAALGARLESGPLPESVQTAAGEPERR
tara:strand:+ start:2423 stop:3103 length:681 start_codon:yes stop_codon:yes gene_type:complete